MCAKTRNKREFGTARHLTLLKEENQQKVNINGFKAGAKKIRNATTVRSLLVTQEHRRRKAGVIPGVLTPPPHTHTHTHTHTQTQFRKSFRYRNLG